MKPTEALALLRMLVVHQTNTAAVQLIVLTDYPRTVLFLFDLKVRHCQGGWNDRTDLHNGSSETYV